VRAHEQQLEALVADRIGAQASLGVEASAGVKTSTGLEAGTGLETSSYTWTWTGTFERGGDANVQWRGGAHGC
jgi:hypothetical protein